MNAAGVYVQPIVLTMNRFNKAGGGGGVGTTSTQSLPTNKCKKVKNCNPLSDPEQ